jgi:hypothetical protein
MMTRQDYIDQFNRGEIDYFSLRIALQLFEPILKAKIHPLTPPLRRKSAQTPPTEENLAQTPLKVENVPLTPVKTRKNALLPPSEQSLPPLSVIPISPRKGKKGNT